MRRERNVSYLLSKFVYGLVRSRTVSSVEFTSETCGKVTLNPEYVANVLNSGVAVTLVPHELGKAAQERMRTTLGVSLIAT